MYLVWERRSQTILLGVPTPLCERRSHTPFLALHPWGLASQTKIQPPN